MRLIPLVRVWRSEMGGVAKLESTSIWVNPAHILYLSESEMFDPAFNCKVPVTHIHWTGERDVTTVLEAPEYIMEACSAQVA